MNLDTIIREIADEIDTKASEIEASAEAKNPDAKPGRFGIAIATADTVLTAGAADVAFPIQSISKVLAFDLALRHLGDKVFDRVGREPSGDPFNSLVDLERTHGIPRNPFINAGALVVVDMVVAAEQSGDAVVEFVREQVEGREVTLDEEVLREGGDLNRAMLSFMKHHENIEGDLDQIMDAYGKQCAISVDCSGLALAGRFLTHTRLQPDDDAEMDRARRMRTVLALMMTCGHYDGSGDFAVRVGLPSKSGAAAASWRSRRNAPRSRYGRPTSTSMGIRFSACVRWRCWPRGPGGRYSGQRSPRRPLARYTRAYLAVVTLPLKSRPT